MMSARHYMFVESWNQVLHCPQVTVSTGSLTWGQPINDNAYCPDGYRYHDIFHIGLHALTGWSPVTETLLDPGPAMSPTTAWQAECEEILSLLAFQEARRKSFFQNQKPSRYLIRMMRDLTETITACRSIDWADTLPIIYGVHHDLMTKQGGTVLADQKNKILHMIK